MSLRLIDTINYYTIITTVKENPELIQKVIEKRSFLYQSTYSINSETITDDRDLFDNYYQHLLVIKKEGEEVVAGYRFAHTEEVLREFGLNGFYTYKIFDYTEDFFKHIGPSLEIGRMFICDTHQKKGIAFKLLWQSFSKYLIDKTHLKYFYGAISLLRNIDLNALVWIAIFCKTHRFDADIAQKVKARHPWHLPVLDRNLSSFSDNMRIDLTNSEDLLNLTSLAMRCTNFRELNFAFEMHYQIKYSFPTLLRSYEKLGTHFSVFGKNPYICNSNDVFVTTRIQGISQDFIRYLIRSS